MSSRLPIDEEDVSFILEDLHRGRSIVPPHDVPSKPTLVRWDPDRPVSRRSCVWTLYGADASSSHQLSLENCVVMEQTDAEKHTKQCLSSEKTQTPEELWGAEAKRVFESRRDEIKRYREAMTF